MAGEVPRRGGHRTGGTGRASHHLVDSARSADLVVVGRRTRTPEIGAHIGSVTHAVLHPAAVPVAVVPHD
ncbi:universal stress protein [Streptomyces sp. RKAG293]|uniref:universal stress protein n=1 Tax=Streptomyces sp. RKAG293 TaxID=2893403 RepID=UPI0020332BEC|nr:universal stress protein [Streptomyces sp. RKAG293]MCM2417713.1 universal stress protein [Streptomyces sp. RKAG293]